MVGLLFGSVATWGRYRRFSLLGGGCDHLTLGWGYRPAPTVMMAGVGGGWHGATSQGKGAARPVPPRNKFDFVRIFFPKKSQTFFLKNSAKNHILIWGPSHGGYIGALLPGTLKFSQGRFGPFPIGFLTGRKKKVDPKFSKKKFGLVCPKKSAGKFLADSGTFDPPLFRVFP